MTLTEALNKLPEGEKNAIEKRTDELMEESQKIRGYVILYIPPNSPVSNDWKVEKDANGDMKRYPNIYDALLSLEDFEEEGVDAHLTMIIE